MSRFSPYLLRDACHWYVHILAVFFRTLYLFWLKVFPHPAFEIKHVIYNEFDQKLELYLPKKNPELALKNPIIVFVHGGAWTFGFGSRRDFYSHCMNLVKRGYIVATVGYRLAPRAAYPAAYNDVNDAVYWLKRNVYGCLKKTCASQRLPECEPVKLLLIGHSAGGHLALLNALRDPKLPILAVVSLAGPTDLTDSKGLQVFDIEKRLFLKGASPIEASPITYVRPDAPPVILYHGDIDSVVNFAQSQLLYDRLKAAGAPVSFKVLKGKGHWFPFVSEDNMGLNPVMLDQFIQLPVNA